MNTKDEALLAYLEFNLVGMVNNLAPYMKEDVDMAEVYSHASDVLDEMRMSLMNPTGNATEIS